MLSAWAKNDNSWNLIDNVLGFDFRQKCETRLWRPGLYESLLVPLIIRELAFFCKYEICEVSYV